jgi:hypothetical protein
MFMRIVLIATMLFVIGGCVGPKSITRGIKEPSQMVEVILSQVPMGTSVADAQTFMEQEGFVCLFSTNAEFQDRKELDYIYCDRSEGWLVTRRWQVAVVHQADQVLEVLASTGLVGL